MYQLPRRDFLAGVLLAMTFPHWSAGFANPGQFSKVVVVISKPGQGIFGYTPSPGTGNLVFSIVSTASPSGNDGHGNTYLPGITAYNKITSSDFRAMQLNGGGFNIWKNTSAGGSWNLLFSGGIQADEVGFSLSSLVSANGIVVGETAAGLQVTGGANILTGLFQCLQALISVSTGTNIALDIVNAVSNTASLLRLTTAVINNNFLSCRVTGDANPRIIIDTDSIGNPRIGTGPATTVQNTFLKWNNPNNWACSPLSFLSGGNASGEVDQTPAFANSWSQAAGRAATTFRRIAIIDTMEWVGSIVVPTGFAAGQNIITANPAAYQPTNGQSLTGWDINNNLPVRLFYLNTGILQFSGPTANTAVGHIIDIPCQQIRLTD